MFLQIYTHTHTVKSFVSHPNANLEYYMRIVTIFSILGAVGITNATAIVYHFPNLNDFCQYIATSLTRTIIAENSHHCLRFHFSCRSTSPKHLFYYLYGFKYLYHYFVEHQLTYCVVRSRYVSIWSFGPADHLPGSQIDVGECGPDVAGQLGWVEFHEITGPIQAITP